MVCGLAACPPRFLAPNLVEGFAEAYKAFSADVELAGGGGDRHCPNTGPMTGCSSPEGTLVRLRIDRAGTQLD